MAISRIKTSSVLQGFPKSRSLLAGNAAFNPSSYESIASTIVGAGGASSVDFTSIPSTYTHLQLRIIGRCNVGVSGNDNYWITFNNDSGSNYTNHYLFGTGSTTGVGSISPNTQILVARTPGTSATTSIFGAAIIDILDYKNTNKNKTVRSLTGADINGSGDLFMFSGAWLNTNTITSIKVEGMASTSNAQYSSIALYGIKG
jgi:hypothetical protein